jgi:SnoaL-like protein
MSSLSPADEALAYLAITRLQAAYADVVTRRAWPELEELFLPDTAVHVDTVTADVIELVGPKNFGDFVAGSIERFEFFEFVILNTVIDVASAASATGRMYMVELRQDRASGGWSNAFGVYHDTYVFDDGRWRFAERSYQSLARTGRYEIFPFPSKFAGPLG